MENMPPEKGFQPLKKRMKFPLLSNTVQQVKFSIKYFFGKYDQIRSFLRIWSHLLKKYLIENFIFCAVRDSPENVMQGPYQPSVCNPSLFLFLPRRVPVKCSLSQGLLISLMCIESWKLNVISSTKKLFVALRQLEGYLTLQCL